jgi:hypothetical protein
VFHQPLRQTEGQLRSIADVPEINIAIPDHTMLSRRGGGLTILPKQIDREEPLHLLVDSTGLRIYGEGEWLDQKHGIRSGRRWRKPHLGMDANTHEIAAVELTPDDVGDSTEIPNLPIRSMRMSRRWRRTVRMMARLSAMLSPNVFPKPRSLFHHGQRRLQVKQPRRGAIYILQRSESLVVWVGGVVPVIIEGAWSRALCFATKP